MEEEKFKELLSAFALDGDPISVERFGEGHINETYLVKTAADGGNKINAAAGYSRRGV